MYHWRRSRISLKALIAYPVLVICGFKLFPVDHSGPKIFFIFFGVFFGFFVWVIFFELFYTHKEYLVKYKRSFKPNVNRYKRNDADLYVSSPTKIREANAHNAVVSQQFEPTPALSEHNETETENLNRPDAELPPIEFSSLLDKKK